MADDLAPCPCGQVPEKLCVQEGSQGYKWGLVNGYCCGEWNIEFRTSAQLHVSEEDMRLAREAWNAAPRGKGG